MTRPSRSIVLLSARRTAFGTMNGTLKALSANDLGVHASQAAIADAGGLPCSAGDVTSVLTKAKLLLGSLIGDQAILRVMRVNEDEASTAYRHALPVPEPFDALVQRQLEALCLRGWLLLSDQYEPLKKSFAKYRDERINQRLIKTTFRYESF